MRAQNKVSVAAKRTNVRFECCFSIANANYLFYLLNGIYKVPTMTRISFTLTRNWRELRKKGCSICRQKRTTLLPGVTEVKDSFGEGNLRCNSPTYQLPPEPAVTEPWPVLRESEKRGFTNRQERLHIRHTRSPITTPGAATPGGELSPRPGPHRHFQTAGSALLWVINHQVHLQNRQQTPPDWVRCGPLSGLSPHSHGQAEAHLQLPSQGS